MVTGFIRRYPKLAVTVVGIWFVFVMLFLGEATRGAAYGVPMHLIGATFFVILLAVKLIGDRNPQPRSQSQDSTNQTPSVPDIDTIQNIEEPEISPPDTLQDGYSTEPENMEFGGAQTNRRTRTPEPETEERDNGLEALRDTEIVDED